MLHSRKKIVFVHSAQSCKNPAKYGERKPVFFIKRNTFFSIKKHTRYYINSKKVQQK